MAKAKKILEDAALILGLKYDKKKLLAWGTYRGFTLMVAGKEHSKYEEIVVSLCASFQGVPMQTSRIQGMSLPDKVRCTVEGFRVSATFQVAGKQDKNVEKTADCARLMLDFILANDGQNCDEEGIIAATNVWCVGGGNVFLSGETAERIQANFSKNAAAYAGIKENYVLGVIGALLGAVVGGALVLLVAWWGFVSFLCCVAMGFAIVLGYRKLGGKFTKTSFVICVLISVPVTYFICQLDATIALQEALQKAEVSGISFRECLTNVRLYYALADGMSTYYGNMIILMLAGVGGTFFAGWLKYTYHKEMFEIYQLV